MKKILILFAVILFGATATFGQVYSVHVSWQDDNCDCLGGTAENYFKVTISIHDDANDEWLIQNKTVTTADATILQVDIPVGTVETYCGQIHQETPSLTLYATVWLMETSTNSACCSGNCSDGPRTCQYYYDNSVQCFVGQLN